MSTGRAAPAVSSPAAASSPNKPSTSSRTLALTSWSAMTRVASYSSRSFTSSASASDSEASSCRRRPTDTRSSASRWESRWRRMRRTVATSSLLSFSTGVNALQSGVEPRHDVPQPLVHLGLDPLQERPGLAQARCQVALVDPLAGRHQALLQGFESGALHASEARGLTLEAVQLADLVAALRLALLHDGGLECVQIGVVAVLETVHGVADALQQRAHWRARRPARPAPRGGAARWPSPRP